MYHLRQWLASLWGGAPRRSASLRPAPLAAPVDAPTLAPAVDPVALLSELRAEASLAADAAVIDELAGRLLAAYRVSAVAPPPFPTMAMRIAAFLRSDAPDFNELVRLIGQEPAVSARILHVANSAAYGPARPVDNIRAAVTLLGQTSAAGVALLEATRSIHELGRHALPPALRALSMRYFHDAATSAQGAAQLAMALGRGRLDLAFLGGMLHDIGKPTALRALVAIVPDPSAHAPALLDAVLERVHVTVGQDLLERWCLPESVVELCRRHHEATLPAEPGNDELHLVRVASGIVAALRQSASLELHAEVLHSLNALGIGPERVRAMCSDARAHSQNVIRTYGLDAQVMFVARPTLQVGTVLDARPAVR